MSSTYVDGQHREGTPAMGSDMRVMAMPCFRLPTYSSGACVGGAR